MKASDLFGTFKRENANRAFDMDDRAVLVEEAQTGYGTLGGEEEAVPKRTCLSPLYDRCLPAIVWIQITLGLPGPTDKPTEETGSKAYADVTKFGN